MLDLNERLSDAVWAGDTLSVKRWLARGGAPTELTKSGTTALHQAARDSMIEIATLLLDSGRADVNVRDARARTPLHLAAVNLSGPRAAELVCLLLRHGADARLRDRRGVTPVDVARVGERRLQVHLAYLFEVN